MAPLPKRKHSKQRKGKRLLARKKQLEATVICKNCGAPKLSHRVCKKCGT